MKTIGDVGRLRLGSQHIARSTFESPAGVVAWLGAIQAQDYAGAKWSIGLRMASATDAVVEQALATGAIIRTWPMRGTLHFVAAQDVRWLLSLVSARNIAHSAGRNRQLGLDDATMTRCMHLFAGALQGGKHRTRAELFALLQSNGISTAGQRGIHILWRAAQEGLICFGAVRGKSPTFVLLEEWAPHAEALDREQSLALIARRYFTSRGPATVHDFAWWMGITLADARIGLELASAHLVQQELDGQVYWLAPFRSTPRPNTTIHLLPGFDEFVLGYKDRSAVLVPEYANRICPGGNGIFFSTIVSAGRIAGTWKRVIRKDRVAISAQAFEALSEAQLASFLKAARTYAKFLGLSVE